MPIPIIDPFGSMQRGMEMREKRDQYNSKQKMRDLYSKTDWSNPQAIQQAIPQAIAAGGPEAASSFVTLLGHMDETQKRQAKQHRDAVGRVWMQIQNAPEQARPQLYAQAQGVYPQEFDQPYSPEALQSMQYELQDFDDAFKSFTQGQEAPKTVGGMQWNPNAPNPQTGGKGAFVAIPGYTEQASAIATAGRAPTSDPEVWETVELPGVGKVQRNRRTGQVQSLPGQDERAPSAFATWLEQFRIENKRNPTARELQNYNASMRDQFIYGDDTGTGGGTTGGGGSYNPSTGTFDTAPAPSVPNPGATPPPAISSMGGGPMMQQVIERPGPAAGGSATPPNTNQGASQGASTYGPGSTPDNRVIVGSHAEWEALPPGTYYRTADGKTGRR